MCFNPVMHTPDFSILFHQFSKDHARKSQHIFVPQAEDANGACVVYYKTYPRLQKTSLEAMPPPADLFGVLTRRESRHNFVAQPLNAHDLSLILQFACGVTGKLDPDTSRRSYPSGGSLFPIEIYPLVLHQGQDIPAGLYHYNVKHHSLDHLWNREFTEEDLSKLFMYPWVASASVVFILTAILWRTQRKYGERGYRYVLLEAGHIGQNIYLVSEALGLKCCAVAGTYDENIEKLLDVDGVTESVVYSLAVGL